MVRGWLDLRSVELPPLAVYDLSVPFHTAVTAGRIRGAFAVHPEIGFVSLAHAEAASGNTDPVAEIGEAMRAQGALFYLDAVAIAGAEPVPPDAPRRSCLSLLDRKERWTDAGRKVLPHAPAQLEMPTLEACLERIESVGLDGVMDRHRSVAPATRAGAVALGGGLEPYVYEEKDAAPVATTLRVPSGMLAAELVTHALADDPTLPVAAGGGALPEEMIRVDHYGADASPETVQRCLAALGTALGA